MGENKPLCKIVPGSTPAHRAPAKKKKSVAGRRGGALLALNGPDLSLEGTTRRPRIPASFCRFAQIRGPFTPPDSSLSVLLLRNVFFFFSSGRQCILKLLVQLTRTISAKVLACSWSSRMPMILYHVSGTYYVAVHNAIFGLGPRYGFDPTLLSSLLHSFCRNTPTGRAKRGLPLF